MIGAPRAVDVVILASEGGIAAEKYVESVTASVAACETEVHLVVGPSATVGMHHHTECDVVVLRSDTVAHGNWLDRLQSAAHSRTRIATVTPVTNDGDLASYPFIAVANALPRGWSGDALDAMFAEVNAGRSVVVPTGAGFCLYVTRESIAAVGPLKTGAPGARDSDEVRFCRRASRLGWAHLIATDTFVEGAPRILLGDPPRVAADARRHILKDPAGPDLAMATLERLRRGALPTILSVKHEMLGGVDRHVGDLSELLRGQAIVFELRPHHGSSLRLTLRDPQESLELTFSRGDPDLIPFVQSLGIDRLHIHHVMDIEDQLPPLVSALNVPYDLTVHDYYLLSPQPHLADRRGRFLGEPETAAAAQWRDRHRALVENADRVIAPSHDTAARFGRYFEAAQIVVAPHVSDAPFPAPEPQAPTGPLRVLVIGSLGPEKGLDAIEECAQLARGDDFDLEFHLVGTKYRPVVTMPRSRLIDHGPYTDRTLDATIAAIDPQVAWFHSTVPETYLYALDVALTLRLPVVVTSIGALPERAAGRAWTWFVEPGATPPEICSLLLTVRRALLNDEPPPRTPPPAAGIDFRFYADSYLDWTASARRAPAPPRRELVEAHHVSRGERIYGVQAAALYRIARAARSHPKLSRLVQLVPHRWAAALRRALS